MDIRQGDNRETIIRRLMKMDRGIKGSLQHGAQLCQLPRGCSQLWQTWDMPWVQGWGSLPAPAWSFGDGWGGTGTPPCSQEVSVCCGPQGWKAALAGRLSWRVSGFLVCLAVLLVCLLMGNCIEINSHLPLPPSLCSSSLRKWGITVQLVRPFLSQIKQMQCLECAVRSWCFCVFIPFLLVTHCVTLQDLVVLV